MPKQAPPPEPPSEEPDEAQASGGIDPVLLDEAHIAYVNNQIYENMARATLPTVSVQTHNPVWAIEHEAEQKRQSEATEGKTDGGGGLNAATSSEDSSDSEAAGDVQGPLPAPEAGEFGNIQPPEGEIWLRIPASYAGEHRDIMAQNADLYRAETGYSGPVTVTLWVGGRPYDRQQYE